MDLNESSNATDSGSCVQTKSYSPLWTYFHYECVDNVGYTSCKVSKCSYRNKGKNNSTLKNHLKSHVVENKSFLLENAEFLKARSAATIDKNNKEIETLPCNRNSEEFLSMKHRITVLAACTSFPLSMISCSEFRDFIADCNPRSAASLPWKTLAPTSEHLVRGAGTCHRLSRNTTVQT